MSDTIAAICTLAPIIPVLVVEDAAQAAPLARALIAGGLPALEVTLRTPAALEAIRAMAGQPGGIVGAGTLLSPEDVSAAKQAGARFGVSPGATPRLIAAARAVGLPLLPGAATASEAMHLLDQGFDIQKFFPAEAAGGVAMLRALGGPLPQVKFCPTGGITPQNAPQYLALANTVCAGGSWVAPKAMVRAQDWAGIEERAREARRLGQGAAP